MDFVFFVTFGKQEGDFVFDESISDDGVLTWQSQPKQKLTTPNIQNFISHDELLNNIYIFLRKAKITFLALLCLRFLHVVQSSL